ncbi:hypothetical protein NXH76_08990 [Blautia schinkii]|nr:hypothetical protein [Blautia schinkii]
MQEKYWKYMVQVKAWIFYLELYADDSYRWEKRINIFSAVTSSTSIAAWAVWQEFSYVWAVIIAVSQVLAAVKGFLPYSQRLKILVPFAEGLKIMYNRMEFNWFKVASGELTEEDINNLLFSFKDEFTKIENSSLKEDTLIERDDLMKKADKKAEAYFENNF